MYRRLINKLKQGRALGPAELAFFADAPLAVAEQMQIMSLLEDKGVTPTELADLAKHLRAQADLTIICPGAVDICGTGGSGLPRLNTSTLAAFLLAAVGVPVAKHGNKAASGRFGSFDLLEGLGLNLEPTLERMSYAYYREQLLFMYARQFFPLMKKFAAARATLGRQSVFNLLGPLLSPANPEYQLIGVADRSKMELMARASAQLGRKRVLVVHGQDGLDEVTLAGRTEVVEINNGRLKKYTISPADFGVKPAQAEDILTTGQASHNIALAKNILLGQNKTRHNDLVLVNTALVLCLAGQARNYREAYRRARSALDQGLAYKKLENYGRIINSASVLEAIAGHKYQAVLASPTPPARVKKSDRDFTAALRRPGLSLIAEIKRGSPSTGLIYRGQDFSAAKIAKIYEAAGARALSVVVDSRYFKGDPDYLKQARAATRLPVLYKEFIVLPEQITAARAVGADAILLIAAILDDDKLRLFSKQANQLAMAVIFEAHNRSELKRALAAGAKIIGINNRDLNTLQTDLKTTARLIRFIPSHIIAVSESGITTPADIKFLPHCLDAILVGSSLMAEPSLGAMAKKTRALAGARKIFKACGIRTVAAGRFCDKIGVDLVGLNFVPASQRCISLALAKQIRAQLKSTKAVGVFMDQPLSYVHKIARVLKLDYVQLSGSESLGYVSQCVYPVIKTIPLRRQSDIALAKKYLAQKRVAFIIFDSAVPGSGQVINYRLLAGADFPYLIAGGVRSDNIKSLAKKINPFGFDVASGLEDSRGQVSLPKIKALQVLTKNIGLL